jgi:hypothetical protein
MSEPTAEDMARCKKIIAELRAAHAKPIFVLMWDLDGTMRSSADFPAGWTQNKEVALKFLRAEGPGYERQVMVLEYTEADRARGYEGAQNVRFVNIETLERMD